MDNETPRATQRHTDPAKRLRERLCTELGLATDHPIAADPDLNEVLADLGAHTSLPRPALAAIVFGSGLPQLRAPLLSAVPADALGAGLQRFGDWVVAEYGAPAGGPPDTPEVVPAEPSGTPTVPWPPAPPAPPAPLGEAHGPRYQIEGPLGEGSFGVVCVAFDPGLNRRVALKRPNQAYLTHFHPNGSELFLAEARLAAQVEHNNVCRVYDCGVLGGVPFFVMERLSQSLEEWCGERGKLAVCVVASIGASIALGLQAIHDKSILHLDLKPTNIMCDEKGVWKITDFTVSRPLGRCGAVVGTGRYRAPEMIRREPVGCYADVYSLAVILYRLLTGAFPTAGLTAGNWEQHTNRPDVPPALVELVLRALSANPAARRTAAELAGELAAFC